MKKDGVVIIEHTVLNSDRWYIERISVQLIWAFNGQVCFEQRSIADPKVLCSTKLKSKRNSSRLVMHREAKYCGLSVENVANGQPLVSRSAATQTRWDRLFKRLQLHPTSTSCSNSEIVVIPSNVSSYLFKNTIVIPSKGSRNYSFQSNRQLFELLVAIP